MKKVLFLSALLLVGSQGLKAQVPEPLVDVDWKAYDTDYKTQKTYDGEGNITSGYTINGVIRCYGSGLATGTPNGVRDLCTNWMENNGTSDSLIWVRNAGNAHSLYDPFTNKWLGCTRGNTFGYYLMFFNNNDAIGQAFANKFTLETTFRMDDMCALSYNSTDGKDVPTKDFKIISAQQSGGWSLQYDLEAKRIAFDYLYNSNETDGEYTASSQWAGAVYELVPGKFYHLTVVVDNTLGENSYWKMYINGQNIVQKKLTGKAWCPPNSGAPIKRKNNMWFCIGGDNAGGNGPDRCENQCRVTFADFKLYDNALSQEQVSTRYNEADVQCFTNPYIAGNNLLLDAVFQNGGNAIDASQYNYISKAGSPKTAYNTTLRRYVLDGERNNQNFFYQRLTPAASNCLGDAFSYEIYCKNNAATFTGNAQSPLSMQQGGGIGFEITTAGQVKFNCNSARYDFTKDENNKITATNFVTNSAIVTSDKGQITTDYTHYVCVYDRINKKSQMYINGTLLKENTIKATDYIRLTEYANYAWFGIGGDPGSASTKAEVTQCDFPFDGQIATARVWAKALTAEDATALYAQATATQETVEIDEYKYITRIFPFAAVVPAGLKAYVVKSANGSVQLTEYAAEGDVIPYGTPVILGSETTGNYTLEAADLRSATIKPAPATNLLEGSFATKDAAADGDMYILAVDNGQLVFAPVQGGTSILAQRAWLPKSVVKLAAAAKAMPIMAPGVTGINGSKVNTNAENTYYDIQGRKVANPTRGLYIKNGQKIWVK